ncbi:MAG TPA: hypothetical protein VFF39_15550 [Verrucomicrobiae bacterium]|nr:hypothetical protein [Verrucomicrobiae bacterium]
MRCTNDELKLSLWRATSYYQANVVEHIDFNMKCRVVAEQAGAQSVHKQLYDHI